MPNLNRVMIMGNLTRDLELKSLQSGQSVAKGGLAVNRKWKDAGGTEKEEVTFIDFDVWGKTAEAMAKYLSKGKPVYIEGRLQLDQWEKDGQKFSKLKVVVESFQFIDGKKDDEPAPARTGGYAGARQQAGKQASMGEEPPF